MGIVIGRESFENTRKQSGIEEPQNEATYTLPETNMETQKGPYKDYSPSKRGLYGFPC